MSLPGHIWAHTGDAVYNASKRRGRSVNGGTAHTWNECKPLWASWFKCRNTSAGTSPNTMVLSREDGTGTTKGRRKDEDLGDRFLSMFLVGRWLTGARVRKHGGLTKLVGTWTARRPVVSARGRLTYVGENIVTGRWNDKRVCR